jgi:hypothetical protein
MIFVSYVSLGYTDNIPPQISYQGKLAENNMPVNGEKSFIFSLMNEQSELWTEPHENVLIKNGIYHVILGAVNPIPLAVFEDQPKVKLKIMVDQVELLPHVDILSVGYAFVAQKAVIADRLKGDTIYINENLNIGIGTTDPKAKLDISGAIRIGSSETLIPAAGTMIFDHGTNEFKGYNGKEWVLFSSKQSIKNEITVGNSGIECNNFSEGKIRYSFDEKTLKFCDGIDWRTFAKGKSDFKGDNWTIITHSAPWKERHGHATIVFDDKMWIFGGETQEGLVNDIWYTRDGVNWNMVASNAQWSPRYRHEIVVFHDIIWLIGGVNGKYEKKIWKSADGFNWDDIDVDFSFTQTSNKLLVFNSCMWVIGEDCVWYSYDGQNWTKEESAIWVKLIDHMAFVHKEKMWVLGGYGFGGANSKIWNTSDGLNWTLVKGNVEFGWRYSTPILSDGEKVWIFGGRGVDQNQLKQNDVWFSENGIDWHQSLQNGQWEARYLHTVIIYKEKFWLFGGEKDGGLLNDVWISD